MHKGKKYVYTLQVYKDLFDQEDNVYYSYFMTSQAIASSFLEFLRTLPYTLCVAFNSNSDATTSKKIDSKRPAGYDLPFVARYCGYTGLVFENKIFNACSGV